MGAEDFVESEVAIVAAATAAVLSPRVRGLLRRGAVAGLSGVITVGETVGGLVAKTGRRATRQVSGPPAAVAPVSAAEPTAAPPKRAPRRPRTAAATTRTTAAAKAAAANPAPGA